MTNINLPLGIRELDNLPNQNHWEKNKTKKLEEIYRQYMSERYSFNRLDYLRHLYVNDIPLYFLSTQIITNDCRWIRSPFITFEDALSQIAHLRSEGEKFSGLQIFNVNELNELTQVYNPKTKKNEVKDYPRWISEFDDRYLGFAQIFYSGLSKDEQKKYLPKETIDILTKSVDEEKVA